MKDVRFAKVDRHLKSATSVKFPYLYPSLVALENGFEAIVGATFPVIITLSIFGAIIFGQLYPRSCTLFKQGNSRLGRTKSSARQESN